MIENSYDTVTFYFLVSFGSFNKQLLGVSEVEIVVYLSVTTEADYLEFYFLIGSIFAVIFCFVAVANASFSRFASLSFSSIILALKSNNSYSKGSINMSSFGIYILCFPTLI